MGTFADDEYGRHLELFESLDDVRRHLITAFTDKFSAPGLDLSDECDAADLRLGDARAADNELHEKLPGERLAKEVLVAVAELRFAFDLFESVRLRRAKLDDEERQLVKGIPVLVAMAISRAKELRLERDCILPTDEEDQP